MSASFDPYHKWLGIAAKDQPPNHYRLLGIDLFEDDREVIDAAANRVMSYLKDLAVGDDQAHSQRIMNEVMQARLCLLNRERKTAYDAELRAKQVPQKPPHRAIKADEKPVVTANPQSALSAFPLSTSPSPVTSRLRKPASSRRPLGLTYAIGGAVVLLTGIILLTVLLTRNGERNEDEQLARKPPRRDISAAPDAAVSQPSQNVVPAKSETSPPPMKDAASATKPTLQPKDASRPETTTTSADPDSAAIPKMKQETSAPQVSGSTPKTLPSPEPLPSAENAGSTRRLVVEAFGEDIRSATGIQQQMAVARRMFQAANDASEKAPKRFVLLTEAQRLAIAAGDTAFVNEIMDRLARDFLIEGLAPDAVACEKKAAILKELSGRAETSMDLVTVAEAALATADLAARDGKPDLANSIIALAIGEARKADDVELFRKATLHLLDLQEGKITAIPQVSPKTPSPSVATTPPSAPPLAIAPFDEATAEQHQEAWAKYLNVSVEMTNSIGMKFVLIPPGEFDMGSSEAEVARLLERAKAKKGWDWIIRRLPTEAPKHRVRITKPFYLGVSEVTQGEYASVMGSNPSETRGDPTRPVEMVNWVEACAFYRKLAKLPAEQAARGEYRLPTEAEWEYACRSGTTTAWYSGNEEDALKNSGWYFDNSEKTAHPVRQKAPNAWGLYDMHGNVWEWCQDWLDERYYATSPTVDPTGASGGSVRVRRGGGFGSTDSDCRASCRNWAVPGVGDRWQGFRLVRSVSRSKSETAELTPAKQESTTSQGRPPPTLVLSPPAVYGGYEVIGPMVGRVETQQMGKHESHKWRDGDQLFWHQAKLGDKLNVKIPVEETGRYQVRAVFTKAQDYAIVQLSLDGEELGEPVDLLHSTVVLTDPISLGELSLEAGDHVVTVEIVGANEQAIKGLHFRSRSLAVGSCEVGQP